MLGLTKIKKDHGKNLLMVFPLELAAHYLRCLELCKRLKGQYNIVVAYSSIYEEFTKDLGFESFKAENFNHEEIRKKTSRFDFSWLNLESIKRVLKSQISVIKEYNPDIILGDASFTLKMATEKTNTNFISLLNGYMTKYYKLTRDISRSHPGYQYSKKMPKKMFELLTRIIEKANFRKIHEPFRKIRKEMRLSPQKYFLDEFEGKRNLICDLPEFFPQKKLPANYNFVGPLFYRGCAREEDLLNFIEDHSTNILVSMGSTGSWDKVSFLNNPVFREYGIITSGNKYLTLKGKNILSKSFVNHTSIMPKIDLLICHGGNGTIYQALSFGTPVICLPNNFEQEWNANRVEDMELGVHLNDVSKVEETKKIIDLWINRKSDTSFKKCKERINLYLNASKNLKL
jgi:UDP:flavonoid glycosyltransferase YjiC (YdhE family)